MKRKLIVSLLPLFAVSIATVTQAGDWSRFRGPNGSGMSPDRRPVPIEWSEANNLKWKVELPGPGTSSPIVVGDRVFVTYWTGYGTNERDPGRPSDLKRHLICIDRRNGLTAWSKSVDAVLPEDPYGGMFAENGYASHTPVSDGERVYVFFGKSGVLAFDLDGKRLWQTSVGTGSGPRGWGSASSPILYKNLVIVTASAESESLIVLNKDSGKEIWRQEASGFSGTWGTPILVDIGDNQQELVLAVPYEIWGFNPDSGELHWHCKGIESNSMCASVIAHDGVVYAVGGRHGGSIAVRAGGDGDVTETHVLWSERNRARIGTPIFRDGRIFWIASGIANCIDAETGQGIYRERLSGTPATTEREPDGQRRRGRRGRGGGSRDYSSAVVAGKNLYYVSRSGATYVLALGPELVELAVNRFASDSGPFSATPAISNGELFIRSSRYLYCVADTSDAATKLSKN